jgi:hypothetical protein
VFFPKVPDLEILSDASLTGWGACCNGVRTRGSWTLQDRERHINELELIGALYAVQAFTAEAKNISVRIYLDNITAVAYINHGGGTKSAELTGISAALTEWCEGRVIGIEAVYLQGRLNIVADEESRVPRGTGRGGLAVESRRVRNYPGNMAIGSGYFCLEMERPAVEVHSLATAATAMMVNAFAINWKDLAGYVFPPFAPSA